MEYFACGTELSSKYESMAMMRDEMSAVRPHLITDDKLSCKEMDQLNEQV